MVDIEFDNVYEAPAFRQRNSPMFLGAIADDVTGGTDLASVLRRAGLTVVQTLDTLAIPGGADAVVVSLKIRTSAPALARSSAGQAAEALRSAGPGRSTSNTARRSIQQTKATSGR